MQKIKQLIQRGISPVLAIIIIIVVSIIVGITLLLSFHFWEQEQPGVFEAEDKIADWEIYRNEEYGFEVKHPKDWKHLLFENWNMISFKDPFSEKSHYKLNISTSRFLDDLDSGQYVQKRKEELSSNIGFGDLENVLIKEIVVSGVPALELYNVTAYENPQVVIYLLKDDYIYDFLFSVEDEKIARQIISTFRFIEITKR